MNNKRMIIWAIAGALALVILLLAVTGVWAEPSQTDLAAPSALPAVFSDTISFQGRLLDSDGNPVDGSPLMTFRLYTQAEGGAPVWEDAYNVPVANGLFDTDLAVPPSLFDGQALWLGVRVEGDAQEMMPRQQLLPAPYAFYAKSAPWDGLRDVPPELADGDDDTQYSAGTGLGMAGTQFSIALAYRLPQGCANGDIPEWNGTSGAWGCGSDDVGGGPAAWLLGGNAGTSPGADVLGTTDPVSLTLVVDTVPALRLEPGAVPNLVGGDRANWVSTGVTGAVIGGGGNGGEPNRVTDDYGAVGGGVNNLAGTVTVTAAMPPMPRLAAVDTTRHPVSSASL